MTGPGADASFTTSFIQEVYGRVTIIRKTDLVEDAILIILNSGTVDARHKPNMLITKERFQSLCRDFNTRLPAGCRTSISPYRRWIKVTKTRPGRDSISTPPFSQEEYDTIVIAIRAAMRLTV